MPGKPRPPPLQLQAVAKAAGTVLGPCMQVQAWYPKDPAILKILRVATSYPFRGNIGKLGVVPGNQGRNFNETSTYVLRCFFPGKSVKNKRSPKSGQERAQNVLSRCPLRVFCTGAKHTGCTGGFWGCTGAKHSQRTSPQGPPKHVLHSLLTTFRTSLVFDRFPRKTASQHINS